MEPTNESVLSDDTAPGNTCHACGVSLSPEAVFCPACGVVTTGEAKVDDNVIHTLAPSFAYYFLTLILLSVYKLTSVMDHSFESMVIITVIDVSIVIVFALFFSNTLAPLLNPSRIRLNVLLSVVLACVLGAAFVYVLAELINLTIYDDTYYSLGIFLESPHPVLYAILLICVQPAIFEEIAFRGFLFTNIQQVTSKEATVYVTAFLFGIIHLAFLGLLWLIPIGIAFGFLRKKYETLWYGIIGHFTYNFVIIAIEYINLNYL